MNILLATLFASITLFANSFIIDENNTYIAKDAINYINSIGDELKAKSQVSSYIYAVSNMQGKDYQTTKKELLTQVTSPYVILFFAKDEKKIDIITDVKYIDTKSIYWDSIAPYIPKKEKLLTKNNITGLLLNGYSAIALSIANEKDFKMKNKLISKSGFYDKIGSYAVMLMLTILVLVFLYAYTRRKPKDSKANNER